MPPTGAIGAAQNRINAEWNHTVPPNIEFELSESIGSIKHYISRHVNLSGATKILTGAS